MTIIGHHTKFLHEMLRNGKKPFKVDGEVLGRGIWKRSTKVYIPLNSQINEDQEKGDEKEEG
jgi:hypothetical protein